MIGAFVPFPYPRSHEHERFPHVGYIHTVNGDTRSRR
jgi:hypothetical protein